MLKSPPPKENIFKNESVIIGGAGPGNPELITLRVLEAIKLADVIIYDALVNKKILKNAKKNCTLIFAGKKLNKKSCTQDDIINWMVKNAKNRKKVLRLKGGDPTIFGRGGEEVDYLIKEKISFKVFSGITASQEAMKILNMNFMTKENNFAMITGHKAINLQTPEINYSHLSKISGKIIIYMGLTQINIISKNLILNGKSDSSEVKIISNISLRNQKKISTNLLECSKTKDKFGLKTPVIIVIN